MTEIHRPAVFPCIHEGAAAAAAASASASANANAANIELMFSCSWLSFFLSARVNCGCCGGGGGAAAAAFCLRAEKVDFWIHSIL
jgi:hypothetical protein